MDEGEIGNELLAGARALVSQGLVTGFGHVSARTGADSFTITPAKPPGALGGVEELIEVSLEEGQMPAGAPGEAWIHWSIYRKFTDVASVCRAQPEFAGTLAIAGVPVVPVYGHGAFLGKQVPVYDAVKLIRSRERGDDLAGLLGEARALIMRGTGSVTVGSSVAESVALMWVLENNARMQFFSRLLHEPRRLSGEEVSDWSAIKPWTLNRVWEYLQTPTSRSA